MPFLTAFEAALADLKSKGVIKRDTDILEPLGYKSKGTVSSYATGAMKMGKIFRTKFEKYYKIKLANYEHMVGKETPMPEPESTIEENVVDPDIKMMYQQQIEVQKRILEDLGIIKVSLNKLVTGKTPATVEDIEAIFSKLANQETQAPGPFRHALIDIKKKEDNSHNVGNLGK